MDSVPLVDRFSLHSSEDPERPWKVIHVRTARESETQSMLTHLGIDAITPNYRIKRQDRRTGKMIEESKVVFSSYVFCRFEQHQRATVTNIIPFVIRILRFDGRDALVQPDEMARIRLMLAAGGPIDARQELRQGRMVRVIKGPMNGLVGDFVKEGKSGIVIVNLPLLGRSCATEIDINYVEPLDKKKQSAA
jgi:transcription termination/antitermination protein NusG